MYVVGVRRLVFCYDAHSFFLYFPHISGAEYGEEFQDEGDDYSLLGQESSNGWSASAHPIYYITAGMSATWSLACSASLRDSSDTTNCMLES